MAVVLRVIQNKQLEFLMNRFALLLAFLATLVLGLPADAETSWTQWRGPNRDGRSTATGLLESWPDDGLNLLWQAEELGSGYASVTIDAGRIFTMGKIDGKEFLIALNLDDGHLLWKTPFGSGDHSNGTPTVDGDLVYAIGLQGDLVCANVKTGKVIWQKNYKKDFDGRMMSGWGYSESPLVDGDHLICTPGANNAMIVALNKQTGGEVWRSEVPDYGDRGKDGAGYSSVVISHAGGVKQYVQLTGRGVIGVRAKDGKFLWGYNAVANSTANIPTPIVKDDYVFCSTGYGTGAALLELKKEGDDFDVEEKYFLKPDTFENHHGGMIRIGEYIYAGNKHNKGFPICIEMETGRVVWGGKQRGPGDGSAAILYADGKLIFRYQSGMVALIDATPDEYRLLGKFKPAYKKKESWAHPVIFDGRMYLREQDKLMCYDVRR